MCELLFILQRISVTSIILSYNVYDISIVCLLFALLNFESFIHGHLKKKVLVFVVVVVVVLAWFPCSFKWNKEVLSLI